MFLFFLLISWNTDTYNVFYQICHKFYSQIDQWKIYHLLVFFADNCLNIMIAHRQNNTELIYFIFPKYNKLSWYNWGPQGCEAMWGISEVRLQLKAYCSSTIIFFLRVKDLWDFQALAASSMIYTREYFYHLPTFLSIRARKYYEYFI